MISHPAAAAVRGSVRPAIIVAVALVLLSVAVAAAFAAAGIRLFAVQTPSMGQTAPVGSLIVSRAEPTYAIGDVVTFSTGDRTVTHRIVAAADESFTTQGDLNGAPDGSPVTADRVIGRAVAILPGVGFLLQVAPWLLLGVALTEALVWLSLRQPGWIWSVRLTGWSLTVTLVALWLRPWFNVQMLDFRPGDDATSALLHVVNTGLFPILAGGTRLLSGQDAVVSTTDRLPSGAYVLTPQPDLDLPLRILVIALCLLPLGAALLIRDDDPVALPDGRRARPDRRGGRIVVPLVILTVLAVAALTTFSATGANLTARVTNSKDTAGTNAFFTCRDAALAVGTSATKGAYALTPTNTPAKTENDLSGSVPRRATYAIAPTSSASVGCLRDSPSTSVSFNGTSQCLYVPGSVTNPNTFTIEAWFRAPSTGRGKIIGFGDANQSAADGHYDRHVYLDQTGRIVFGVYPGSVRTISTPAGRSYADGAWHAVVASLSSAGMALYVDGSLVATNTSITTGENFSGYWKIGCGNLTAWANGTSNGSIDWSGPSFFTGEIQFAAIYTRALSIDEVRSHYAAGR
ncbi:LamG-like jellyroll fold domain-containing protein [Microbacterium testaceum]|uniref:LamG-like jellyroll fold domain-containing protein n=1 Tax=Microbacterium testaceum TaxID=2033 RepID=UPI0007345237|nr:LamG-like jellyroll fold domain-containing protein [Microbacterium testaceum]